MIWFDSTLFPTPQLSSIEKRKVPPERVGQVASDAKSGAKLQLIFQLCNFLL